MVFVTCYPPGLHLATRTQLSHATMCLLAEQVYRAIAVRQSELAAKCKQQRDEWIDLMFKPRIASPPRVAAPPQVPGAGRPSVYPIS